MSDQQREYRCVGGSQDGRTIKSAPRLPGFSFNFPSGEQVWADDTHYSVSYESYILGGDDVLRPAGIQRATFEAEPPTSAELLQAIDLTAKLANLVSSEVIGYGPTRDADIGEFVSHVQVIQHMIQSASRLHPELFRLLIDHT